MLAIDSLYLINFLEDYPSLPPSDGDPEPGKLVQDLLMFENQIPVHVSKEIRKAIGKCNDDGDLILLNQLLTVCKAHSPLELKEERKIVFDNTITACELTEEREIVFDNTTTSRVHMLSYIHNLIVQNRGIQDAEIRPFELVAELASADTVGDQFMDVIRAGYESGICGPAAGAVLNCIDKVPWRRIFALCGLDQDGGDSNEDEIRIPSATQLSKTANIEFKPAKGGIRDVELKVVGKKRIFHLPVIQLRADSEVILRNLVAYEVATTPPGKTLEFAEYIDLMCGIIDTPKDLQLLRVAKIIDGSLENKEIASLFNGIRKTPGTGSIFSKNKSKVAQAVDKANEIFDNTRRVRVFRFFKKKFLTSKTFLSVILTIILVALLAVQTVCQIYGCSSRWFGRS